MNKEQFIKLINDKRKANKNRWYSFSQSVNNCIVSIKGFNTWVQIIEVNHGTHITKDSGPMDCSVKQLNDFLISALYNV